MLYHLESSFHSWLNIKSHKSMELRLRNYLELYKKHSFCEIVHLFFTLGGGRLGPGNSETANGFQLMDGYDRIICSDHYVQSSMDVSGKSSRKYYKIL